MTRNCSSFEREPGADDARIRFNRHLDPQWLERRRRLGLGNVERVWLPEPLEPRKPVRMFEPSKHVPM